MGFPSCDNVGIPPNNYSYTDTGRFEESCEHKYQFLDGPWYGNVQNPCNCSNYLNCGSTQLSECAVGQIFNPCLQACTAYFDAKKCPDFCGCFDGTNWQPGKPENCNDKLSTTTTTTTITITSITNPYSWYHSIDFDRKHGIGLGTWHWNPSFTYDFHSGFLLMEKAKMG